MQIYNLRQDYTKDSLNENEVFKNPIQQFELWFNECLEKNLPEPYAMAISSIDEHNKPHVRIVLMRSFCEQGIKFFTNYTSSKAKQFEHNNHVEVLFFWHALERQVRISGVIEKISQAQSQEYFSKRPVQSQIGAYASPQSQVIPNREFLEHKYNQISRSYSLDNPPVCPPFWGGYIIKPTYFEFWQGRSSRLHDRIIYTLIENSHNQWLIQRLAP